MWTGQVSSYIGRKGKRGTDRPLRHLERRRERRRVLPGYPIEARPFTKQEIVDYFAGDRIVCLLCGKSYRRISQHLPTIHSVTEDEYRRMYGLPWTYGLVSAASGAAYSAAARRRMAEGWVPPACVELTRGVKHRPRQPFQTATAVDNFKAYRRDPCVPGSFDKILKRMAETDRSMGQVLREDDDLPGISWAWAWMRKHPEDRKRADETHEALSFPAQARAQMLGERFWREALALRQAGKSDNAIAKALGVTAMAVHHGRKKRGIP